MKQIMHWPKITICGLSFFNISLVCAANEDGATVQNQISSLDGRLLNLDTRVMYLERHILSSQTPMPLRSPSALNRNRETLTRRGHRNSITATSPLPRIERDGRGYFPSLDSDERG